MLEQEDLIKVRCRICGRDIYFDEPDYNREIHKECEVKYGLKKISRADTIQMEDTKF